MACRIVLRTVFSTEPWLLPSSSNRFPPIRPSQAHHQLKMGSGFRDNETHFFHRLSCSAQDDQGPPQEAVLKAISEVSKTEGRVGQTTNVVIGGTVTDDSTNEWLDLDQKVNSYPTVRGFTAIGTGGEDFVHSMVVAVESVLQQPIPELTTRMREMETRKAIQRNLLKQRKRRSLTWT
ncbi:uncharacterized protein LOC130807838 isoform X3 [Amaranthus tricolor]|uniref:uncharacterized protein LOC130807838 isoform X3 n=1 Tax=Amaranthus tricolor TaxID=29722 RepID=UPI00258AAD0C|nr:uncharacterized protein LOC130807838 isoform X3 [Amaranthus tricolor]